MKKLLSFALLLWVANSAFAQVKIHSHNDYEQKQRFHLAYANEVYEIEADVFEASGELIVAHSKKDLNSTNTLERLYLKPIDSLFKIYKNRVSKNGKYTFALMIDFKTPFEQTYPVLKRIVEKYGDIFNPSKNKWAVRVVISGNRPPDSTFHTYPDWLFFDGLPNVNYAIADFKKVTMISDNFKSYSKWNGIGNIPAADLEKLKEVVEAANRKHRSVRFWGAPDTVDCWRELAKLGKYPIINTDKIVECKTYFK